ncbi:hypothetical protein Pst134EA_011468 [Puccinia striiformis f. sp. tritici]|uniref:hypothetical protein n=1 Tax=Puccinia striiformis f. sp. tritici TaxID=168172 RepID=UPI0020086645|nr:hypothetical protein Pst134EA_011468 [Puccinia striiformis f. sp. tritici]KAH9467848.1 hypothetical protein Pst134EA_011468 [Puccinia striiformis f. sp. tritici]
MEPSSHPTQLQSLGVPGCKGAQPAHLPMIIKVKHIEKAYHLDILKSIRASRQNRPFELGNLEKDAIESDPSPISPKRPRSLHSPTNTTLNINCNKRGLSAVVFGLWEMCCSKLSVN